MKKLISVAALLAVSLTSLQAQAADTMLKFPIAGALAANDAQNRLGDSVKFYFADQPTPKVLTKIASDKTSQRTNGFGKSAEKACNWVFLSAMLALQKRAQELGANAVVNIVSNFKDIEMASQTEFECADGAIMAGVALKGDFVKIAP
ncbi:excinuclease ATPase subunit [Duganella sp. FT80W]|uniref:Excinuclease ATPase subunit n=1 Tax=Duganella guangzhouensis TaxID=2666084 RepID=A0A6I2KW50_9BURK|nr:excinuclease ATPase subunit [Duganella guangzhouensis]MRW89267.1 excinuclease ATPase subunit [Duganella guangzhouensis]